MTAHKGYGQFCPVAKAAEVVAERWTPLVLRELIEGSTRFNELRRGVPLMSSALLSRRLRELEDAGVVERRPGPGRSVEYLLTSAGEELRPIIEALGVWGARWTSSRLEPGDYDPSLLMWDVSRRIDSSRLPAGRRIAIEFDLRGAERVYRRWWLVVDGDKIDLCLKDPGYPVDLLVAAELHALVDVWRGVRRLDAEIEARRIAFEGPPKLAASFRQSLKLSPFKDAVR